MDVSTVSKLYNIFNTKGWSAKEGNDIVFFNFCKLLTNLEASERQLIVELADRYTWITLSEYQGKLISVLNSVEDEKLNGIKKIVLFPVMKPEDEAKTKSGHTILYMLRAIKPILTKYKTVEFVEFEAFEKLNSKNFKPKDNELLFLLDDYLGSGETIKTTVEVILKNRNINPTIINVISIVAQNESIDFLSNIGISIYTDLVSQKGITDYYNQPERDEKIELMKKIEKLIPGNHFSFGYNESEALVTLMRTPDNTFPIFWKEHRKNNEKFEAPFSRY